MYLNTAETGELDKLKECLANGVPLTYASNLGVTALHMAAISGQPHIVEFLIGKGADLKGMLTERARGSAVGREGLWNAM